jgi:hypothetical protein
VKTPHVAAVVSGGLGKILARAELKSVIMEMNLGSKKDDRGLQLMCMPSFPHVSMKETMLRARLDLSAPSLVIVQSIQRVCRLHMLYEQGPQDYR